MTAPLHEAARALLEFCEMCIVSIPSLPPDKAKLTRLCVALRAALDAPQAQQTREPVAWQVMKRDPDDMEWRPDTLNLGDHYDMPHVHFHREEALLHISGIWNTTRPLFAAPAEGRDVAALIKGLLEEYPEDPAFGEYNDGARGALGRLLTRWEREQKERADGTD